MGNASAGLEAVPAAAPSCSSRLGVLTRRCTSTLERKAVVRSGWSPPRPSSQGAIGSVISGIAAGTKAVIMNCAL